MGDWVEVAKVSEFDAKDRKLVHLGGGRQAALFKLDDGFYAVGAWCSHEKRPMLEGELMGHEIMCAAHGARFDLRTGRPLSLPAVQPILRFDVKVEGDAVLVRA